MFNNTINWEISSQEDHTKNKLDAMSQKCHNKCMA